jgi:hypothetical protein
VGRSSRGNQADGDGGEEVFDALLFEHGERPGPARKLAGDADVGDRGTLLARVEPLPALVQSAVAFVAADPGRRRGEFPPIPHRLAGHPVKLRVVPSGLDQQPASVGVARLGDRARERDWPEEDSVGTSPTNAPMVAPVNLCQSPISTASAKPVSVEMPRRQPSRRTTGV